MIKPTIFFIVTAFVPGQYPGDGICVKADNLKFLASGVAILSEEDGDLELAYPNMMATIVRDTSGECLRRRQEEKERRILEKLGPKPK